MLPVHRPGKVKKKWKIYKANVTIFKQAINNQNTNQ